jgi:hypothetical protein
LQFIIVNHRERRQHKTCSHWNNTEIDAAPFPAHDDSALYEKMGYVRKSTRASGLTRKSKTATAAVK